MSTPPSISAPPEGPVLVTGASGFIGRHLVHRLARAGCELHGVGRGARPEGLPEDLRWHRADLADGAAVDALVRTVHPATVYHLASKVAGGRDLALVGPTFGANLASTVHLLTAVAEHGCTRFVQAGSLEEPEADHGASTPSSPYAAAKAAASSYLRMFHRLYDVPVVLARLFMVYGPGPQDTNKLVPYVIQRLLAGEEPQLSSGVRPVDWIYVEDVAEGLARLGSTPGLEGGRVDLGSGQLHTVREVVETLHQLVAPHLDPRFGGRADRTDEQVRRAAVEDTEGLLGWRPRTGLREGLAATVEGFRSRI
ncbi:MAG: NAD(P)-dependent oxidoreductase [Acidobacteriota bacterium]